MKNAICSAALGFLTVVAPPLVHAAGAYDGIYQLAGSEKYYSVHQKNASMIFAGFYVEPQSQFYDTLENGQNYVPNRLDHWDLYTGQVSGAFVSLRGESAFGACVLTHDVTFNANGATITLTGATATPSGVSQGINCTQVMNALIAVTGRTYALNKVF